MTYSNKKYWAIVALLFLFSACELHDDVDTERSSGEADFSNYVAIGNSITSGFQDGDLYLDAQWTSFPQYLSEQMDAAGGGEFRVPLMYDNYGFGNRIIIDLKSLSMKISSVTPDARNKDIIADQGPFDNMGVPGAKVADLLSPTMSNPRAEGYYQRMTANYGTSVIMDEVMAQQPSFVTLWIGTNDAMGYALRGGDIDGQPSEAITSPEAFRTSYQAVVDKLGDTQGVVANLPSVSVLPYFSANEIMKMFFKGENNQVLDMFNMTLTAEQAADYNAKIAALEQALKEEHNIDHSYGINFQAGANAVLVEDPQSDLPTNFKIRQAISTDKFCLEMLGVENITGDLSLGLGFWKEDELAPIPNKYVLDAVEQKTVDDAISAYNEIIADIVNQKEQLSFLDVASYMDQLKDGIVEGEKTLTATFLGGFFSYDGVHPNPDGHALIANRFIETINATFGSNLDKVKVNFISGSAKKRQAR